MRLNKPGIPTIWIVSLLILSGCAFKNQNIKTTYLGNCGFMYEQQSSKILIDAFGTKFGNFFLLPTDETRTSIIEENPPFNNIDLILITHRHGDHFDPFLATEFLEKNKNTKMICPPQVFNEMKDSCSNFSQVEAQIISPDISMHEAKNLEINGISLTAIRMQHGTNRSLEGIDYKDYTYYEKTEDFGYLIDFNKKTVFHQGDGCLKINEEALNNIQRKVDIAHLSYFDWDSTSYQLVKDKLQANYVVFMHGTKPGKELEREELKAIESNLIRFEHELESKVFE